MLKQLYIRNWALAENLEIEFHPHLNILTGETGAGKSILVGAIAAVLGGRVYTEVIRTGFEKAFVEAVFDISALPEVRRLLQEKGVEAESELYIRREISLKSSSRAFLNDVPVTVSTLAEVGDLLMDIHGQHEHQSLLRKETHRRFLDDFGQLSPQLAVVGERYLTVKELEKSLRQLQQRQQELESKRDLYEFQYQEIEKAALQPREEESLEDERRVLANVEKLFEIAGRLNDLFNGEELSLLEAIGQVEQQLQDLQRYVKEMEKLAEEFTSAKIVMEETSRSIEEFQSQLEYDPQRLEEVEQRLDLINRLKKKYGAAIEDILAYQQEIKAALNLQENYQHQIAQLQKQHREALGDYAAAAGELSRQRREVAERMERLVEKQLSVLGMPHMRFQASLERQEDARGLFRENDTRYYADEFGVDQVEFYISPNPGEEFKPLSKIASGGEISRIMLALKSILAEIDQIPSLIFDEIDLGVSGRIAQAVGRSIYQLSRSHQIVSITHLPQIAAYGEAHYLVEKYVENERTFTRIYPLSETQRVEAIARLIGGETISETVLESARQLIAEGRQEDQ